MKLAFIVAGVLRNVGGNLENILQFVKQEHDVDLYASFNGRQNEQDIDLLKKHFKIQFMEALDENSWLDAFLKVQDETKCCDIKRSLAPEFYGGKYANNILASLRCFFSARFHMQRCLEEMKCSAAQYEYDAVVWIRFDQAFQSKVNFQSMQFDSDLVYIPANHDHGGLNDRFAVGHMKAMDVYCRQLDFVPAIFCNYERRVNPEKILKYTAMINKLRVARFALESDLRY